jgi:PAS domain S-box-containing protein
MKDKAKSKEQLISELAELRQRIAELEHLEIEHKGAEEALRDSEERYRNIVESQMELVCRFLLDGTLTFVNEAICRILGQAREEIIGQNFYTYVHPDDQEKTRRNLESLSIDSPVGSNEERVILPDGEMRWWQWSNQASFDSEGRVIEFQAVGRDITERVQTERRLQESEQRFRETVQLLPSIVVEYDNNFRVTYANQAGYDTLGYTPADVEQGVDVPQLFPPAEQEKLMGRLTSLLAGENTPPTEYRLLHKDGSIIHCLVSSLPIYRAGKVVGIRSSATNITEHKRAEEQLRESEERHRSLLEASPDPVVVYDIEGKATYVSPAFEQTFGWSSEELIGNRIDFVPEENWPETKAAIQRMLKGERIQSFETKRFTKDGRILDIQISSSLFEDRDGSPTGNIVILRDVTNQKLAQEAMRASEEKFRALFDHIPTMAFVIDRHHRLVASNWAFQEKMGGQVDTDTLNLAGVSTPKKEFWHGVEKQVIESGHPTWYVEMAESGKRGRTFIECRKQPITDQDGNISMVVGIATDITDYVKEQIALAEEVRELRVQISKEAGPTIIGKSKKISEALGRVKAIAGTDTSVLITGESGSGKELVAEAIHNLSHRSGQSLIKVNCAALPESIIESELFGHIKGAFTGAVSNRIGRFEAAHRGTIFLDEIGDISSGVQVRLLRVLEERKIERVGDYKPIKVNVRIIAATHQNLRNLVEKGRFREDLFYRLNVFNVHVPPLRERAEDIPLLVAHFINDCSREMRKEINSVSDEAMNSLLQHNWRGNVRELMNVIESACVLCTGKTIHTEHLPPILESWTTGIDSTSDRDIHEALRLARGNKAKAARLLGIHRSTLYRRMERYRIATE